MVRVIRATYGGALVTGDNGGGNPMRRALGLVMAAVTMWAPPAGAQDDVPADYTIGALGALAGIMEMTTAETTAEAQEVAGRVAQDMTDWLIAVDPPECLVPEYLAYWRLYAALYRVGQAQTAQELIGPAEDAAREFELTNELAGACAG